jgi:hypothetical protein
MALAGIPEGMLRASGNAVADREQFAINQALLQARTELGRQLQTMVEAFMRIYDQEHGAGRDANASVNSARESIQGYVNQAVGNSRPICQNAYDQNGRFNVYVAVEMPLEQAARNIHRRLTQDQIISIDFQESQFLKDLETARKQFYEQR